MRALVKPARSQNLALTKARIFQDFSKILLQAFFLGQQAYYMCFSASQLKICRFEKRYLKISRSIVLQLCYKTSIGLAGVQISKFFQIFSLNEVFVGTEMGKICVEQFLRYFGTLNHPNVLWLCLSSSTVTVFLMYSIYSLISNKRISQQISRKLINVEIQYKTSRVTHKNVLVLY